MNHRVCCLRESLPRCYRVNLEALLRAIILEDEEDDDLLIYCIKPWFLTTTLWCLHKRDAARRSQSCGFEGGWFLRVALMSVPPWHCADSAASWSWGIPSLTSACRGRSLLTTGRKSCYLFTAVVFLYTTSCKEEFDEKLIDCVHSFPVLYDLSQKS